MDRVALRYDQGDDERRLIAALEGLSADYGQLDVYLFGSRAGEDYLDTSDWDLIFVSPAFEGVPFLRRLATVAYRLGCEGIGPVEAICYTPDEFASKAQEPTPIGNAIRTARRLR
jgi:hypothetical protein